MGGVFCGTGILIEDQARCGGRDSLVCLQNSCADDLGGSLTWNTDAVYTTQTADEVEGRRGKDKKMTHRYGSGS